MVCRQSPSSRESNIVEADRMVLEDDGHLSGKPPVQLNDWKEGDVLTPGMHTLPIRECHPQKFRILAKGDTAQSKSTSPSALN